MKKYIVLLLIVVAITLLLSITVHAAYVEPLPANTYNLPYMIILHKEPGAHSPNGSYILIYKTEPFVVKSVDYYGDGTGYFLLGIQGGGTYDLHWFEQKYGSSSWELKHYATGSNTNFSCTDIVYCNYSLGLATTTFELEENQSSFFGIDFDYSGFFGDLKIQLGKKQESGTYKIIKEWQYPRGEGNVSIPESEIPQGNKGEYVIIIYEGDTIINQYPYTLNVEKEPYCEINYPINGQSYNYYPNVNIRYYDMGRLYIYINGEMYKQIQTKDIEGIEVVSGKVDLFDIGLNTVTVMNSSGQDVATVQYMVLREGPDLNEEFPEYDAESWVQQLFNKIMNEYSLFFEYVRGIYGFLPVEIVGLVAIVIMLAVVLWFTGRK